MSKQKKAQIPTSSQYGTPKWAKDNVLALLTNEFYLTRLQEELFKTPK